MPISPTWYFEEQVSERDGLYALVDGYIAFLGTKRNQDVIVIELPGEVSEKVAELVERAYRKEGWLRASYRVVYMGKGGEYRFFFELVAKLPEQSIIDVIVRVLSKEVYSQAHETGQRVNEVSVALSYSPTSEEYDQLCAQLLREIGKAGGGGWNNLELRVVDQQHTLIYTVTRPQITS